MFSKNCFLALFCFFFVIPFAVPVNAQENALVFPPQAVIIASYRGDAEMLTEILISGADRDVRDALGSTALHVAMFQPNSAVVRILLEHGFDPNAIAAKNGYTPLHNAVAANNLTAARLLLQYGADRNIECLEGQTPLNMARKEEKGAMVNILYR